MAASVGFTIAFDSPDEEGSIVARVLEVPGAISQGRTRAEARENVLDALGTVLTPDEELTGEASELDPRASAVHRCGMKRGAPVRGEVRMVGANQTTVSSKHQVTIPSDAFAAAGLGSGDILRVEATGRGRIVLSRVDDLVDRYSGSLATGGDLRQRVEGLREEWRSSPTPRS